jgi:hypothetical protein
MSSADHAFRWNGAGAMGAEAARDALDRSRVDLLALLQDGMPERDFLPGSDRLFVRGKRHHIAADAKTGKSISIAVVAALDIVTAGGIVVVLDLENGSEEYARRLGSVLDARECDDELRELVRENYRYHAWPALRLEWGKDPTYPDAFAGTDLVIFDSCRKFLTSVGLDEDSSDDYSRFTDALIDPLARAGIATGILDNAGHTDKNRSRGTSSKADLCDLMYSLKTSEKFSKQRQGQLELECTHSRIGEITGTWTLDLGAGYYDSWTHQTAAGSRQRFHDACVAALRETAPLARDALVNASRSHGAKGKQDTLREWLSELATDPFSSIDHTHAGYALSHDPDRVEGVHPHD